MGPEVTAKRREALESTTFTNLTSSEEKDCFAFFPLLSRGGRSASWGKVWGGSGPSRCDLRDAVAC
jgi:hypothetical protein